MLDREQYFNESQKQKWDAVIQCPRHSEFNTLKLILPLNNIKHCKMSISFLEVHDCSTDFPRFLFRSTFFDSEEPQRSSLSYCPASNNSLRKILSHPSPGRWAENVLWKIVRTPSATTAVCKWSSLRERFSIIFYGLNGFVGFSHLSLISLIT